MRTVSDGPPLAASKNAGIVNAGAEEIFRPCLFGDVARLVYPGKTDAKLAAIARKTDRAARAWMDGSASAPAIVYAAMFMEIARRR